MKWTSKWRRKTFTHFFLRVKCSRGNYLFSELLALGIYFIGVTLEILEPSSHVWLD